ncbi:hypothetical protein [Methylomonas rhizoryzae]|uniref:hypothetical protein n=1 Tax=Methylomonas rhizoryzae TaxID=2608981 RepID=UPI001231B71A|nr:hypothetical protein [Methylomonas rhizoryzae]
MAHKLALSNKLLLPLLLSGYMSGSTALADVVSGRYQGTINFDSGLGLLGQIMYVDFSYDAGVPYFQNITEPPLHDAADYFDYLLEMRIRIGDNVWDWQPTLGTSFISLYNDSLISTLIGTEDRIVAYNDAFTGPLLVPGVEDISYAFSLYLSDNLGLDGLDTAQSLPNSAPNPELFNNLVWNSMEFAFFTGNGESGEFYFITTSDVTPVPIPGAYGLFASAILLLPKQKRSG